MIKLPKGATPMDYAYSGSTPGSVTAAWAPRSMDIRVPLWTRLKNGQSVEIITAEGQTPQATWVDIVVTGRAKAAIRKSLREEDRERFIRLGRELARVAFEHVGKKASDKALKTAANKLALENADEVLARLGSAELRAHDVLDVLYPNLSEKTGETVDAEQAVVGLSADQNFSRAQCCQPVPGERIVGITYRGRGVVVHAIDCPALAELEETPDRWIDLAWHSGRHMAAYAVTLSITISNDAGVLGRICTLIGEQKANIADMHFTDKKHDFFKLLVDIELRDVEHLHAVMTALEADSNVAELFRYNDIGRKP